jgi:hypothetical protein
VTCQGSCDFLDHCDERSLKACIENCQNIQSIILLGMRHPLLSVSSDEGCPMIGMVGMVGMRGMIGGDEYRL